jgi:hypothetical protein
MSGPKVVRIVTREEIIAICEQHLARLDAAIAAWTTSGQRNDVISESDITAIQKRRAQLGELLAADAFLKLQKDVPKEIAFLEVDMQSRLASAIARVAAERTRQRRRARAARTLLTELQASGKEVPPALIASLDGLSTGRGGGMDADRVFSEAFALFAGSGISDAPPERTNEIAVRLAEGERSTSFAAWRVANLEKDDDGRLTSVDGLIAELHSLDDASAEMFEQRMATVSAESSPARKRLLVDSFIADLAAATRTARDKCRVLAQLREQLAEVGRFTSNPARALAADMEAALAASDTSRAESLLPAATALVTAEIGRISADARRSAILHGLSSLGYEVREGMATAFAKGEAIVMRHANTPGFGLEVSGPPEAQRLQMRVVAFSASGTPRDTSRDRDIELQWCGSFDKLREVLAGTGADLDIERSVAAGALPLKVISGAPSSTHSTPDETELRPKSRMLQIPRS